MGCSNIISCVGGTGRQEAVHLVTTSTHYRMCQFNWTADAAIMSSHSSSSWRTICQWYILITVIDSNYIICLSEGNDEEDGCNTFNAVQPLKSMRCIQITVLVVRRTAPRSQRTIIIAYYNDLALQITFFSLPSIFLALPVPTRACTYIFYLLLGLSALENLVIFISPVLD